ASWTAGEIGHLAIDPSKARCRCGQRGCLELLINQDVFIDKAKELGLSPKVKNGEIEFNEALKHSDQIKETMHIYGVYLGKALVQVVHLMNPNNIVVDAPYNVYEEFKQGCTHYLNEYALKIPIQQTNVVFGYQQYNMSLGAALSTVINFEKAYG